MKNSKWLALALLAAQPAVAGDMVQWWDASVTALYGDDYDLAASDEQTTITLETAGAWKYGDWFAFHDFTYYHGSANEDGTNYGEISPRFSLGKITGNDVKLGAITDVSVALTLEHGKGPTTSFLYGVGLDIAVPYFTYFNVNTYRRDAISNGNYSDGWQVTPAFRMDFPVGNSAIIVDGYIDWVFATDENDSLYKENIHFNPQIKYDLGAAIFGASKKNQLLVGVEYDYWKNKYGVDGIDQNTYSVIAQYHF